VYVTPTGRPVIVEAKLWRNPDARRKVIGQILDYAKELSRWNYDTFDAAVRRARRAEDGPSPKGLAEIAGFAPGSPEAARFFDAISQSLRRGDLLLLIVGDGIREGVGAITEFLEGHGSLHFTFGLVEMAIFRMPDGGQLVQPRVLAQSTIIRRIVVDLRNESLAVIDDDVRSDEDPEVPPELIALREKFQRFWVGFLEKLQLDDHSQPLKPPAKGPNQHFPMPKGSEAWVSAFLHQSGNRAGVYLRVPKGPIGDRLYASLKDDKGEVERALGVPAEWRDEWKQYSIVTARNFPGSLIEDHGNEIQPLLADWVNRYVNVFRPRLEKLVREAT
jgi:hypothetical protein